MSRAPRRKAPWARVAALGTTAAVVAAAVWLAPAAAGVLVQLFQLLLRGSLWLATSVVRGDDAWTISAAVGRGLTTALVSPSALAGVGALLLIGAAALYGLQRLLDSEQAALRRGEQNEESSQ